MFDYARGVRDGRAVAAVAGRTRRSLSTRCRAGASGSRPRSGLASDAGVVVATGGGVAKLIGAAQFWSAGTLPTLRSGASPMAGPTEHVFGVAYRARLLGWRVVREWRGMIWGAARSKVDAVLVQPHYWIDLLTRGVPHLEVQMRSRRITPVAHLGDLLARSHFLAFRDKRSIDVPVHGSCSVGMPNSYPEAKATRWSRFHDDAVSSGQDWRPDGIGKVNSPVEHAPPRPVSRCKNALCGQDEPGPVRLGLLSDSLIDQALTLGHCLHSIGGGWVSGAGHRKIFRCRSSPAESYRG